MFIGDVEGERVYCCSMPICCWRDAMVIFAFEIEPKFLLIYLCSTCHNWISNLVLQVCDRRITLKAAKYAHLKNRSIMCNIYAILL